VSFPQQPFELFEELVCFSAAQFGLDAGLIELYRKWQPTSGPGGHVSTSLGVAASIPNGLAGTLEDLLVVKPDETGSGLHAIKANPSKPSVGCDAHFTRQTEGHRSYGRAWGRSLVAQRQLPAGAVHSANLGIKTFLLIECGTAVLSPLLNAVISDGNHTHHHRRNSLPQARSGIR